MSPFSTDNSCITLALSKPSLFISSYPGKIVFGQVNDYQYVSEKHFVFYRCNYISLYKAIVLILKSISADTGKEADGKILTHENLTYTWQTKDDCVWVQMKRESHTVYQCSFNFEQLNNFFDCFNELILSTLLIRGNEREIFELFASFPLEKLVAIEKDPDLLKFEVGKVTQNPNTIVLIRMNYDVIFLMHKLTKLVKTDYRTITGLMS